MQVFTNRNTIKVEQTSQTYGQFFQLLTGQSETSSNRSTQGSSGGTIVPTDSIVRVIRNDNNGGDLILSDTDKARIALAATSDSFQPTVAVNTSIVAGENVLATNAANNFSEVVLNNGPAEVIIVAGSSYKPIEEIKEILTEAQKIDMMITLKSKDSEALEFNNLKEAQLESKFVYNFFSASEGDVESQEDPAQDPYLKSSIFNVPRYVKLTWEPAMITEPLSQEELEITPKIEELKREIFTEERTENTHIPLLNRDGFNMEITDMHRLDLAIQSTSNRNVFANSLSAILNLNRSPNFINLLPIRFLGGF